MKTVGIVFGWIGFGWLAFLTIGMFIFFITESFYYGFDFALLFVMLLFIVAPLALWLVATFINNRSAKFVLFIVFAAMTALYSPLGIVGGVILAITTHKEKEIAMFKKINNIYPWEVQGNLRVYPEYIYKEFGCYEMIYQKYTNQMNQMNQVHNTQTTESTEDINK